MLQRFFAKKHFHPVDYYLEEFYRLLEIPQHSLKSKKQFARHNRPYSIRTEGTYKTIPFTLSISYLERGTQLPSEQVEIILQCKNADWSYIDIRPKGQAQKKLDTVVIPFLDIWEEAGIEVETNNKYFVLECFNDSFCHQFLNACSNQFEQLTIDRQKLYFKATWLPDSAKKTKELFQIFKWCHQIVLTLDKS